MADPKTLKAGDDCPRCGGEFVPDVERSAEAVIDRHGRVAASPAAHAEFAKAIREKEATEGVLHRCGGCGYQHRFEADKAKGRRREPVAQ